jgi:hypothetical protein
MAASKATKKRVLSAEGKKKIQEAQKRRWAAKQVLAAAPTTHIATLEDKPAPANTAVLSFGSALDALKKGLKVARAGWNGKGMFVFLVPGSQFKVNRHPLLGIYPEGTEIDYRPHIDMKTADGRIVPWVASQTDLLADDWQIVL